MREKIFDIIAIVVFVVALIISLVLDAKDISETKKKGRAYASVNNVRRQITETKVKR